MRGPWGDASEHELGGCRVASGELGVKIRGSLISETECSIQYYISNRQKVYYYLARRDKPVTSILNC